MSLNRTNLTLSALALSNGLNLGTRSLTANASVNDGDQTLRTRHSHHDVMRERMVWYVVSSISKPKDAIPAIPSSFFSEQPSQARCVTLPQGYVADDGCVESDPRLADKIGRRQPCVFDHYPSIQTIVPTTGHVTRGAAGFKPRPGLKSSGIPGLKRTARRAAAAAAATMSAASGK
jgi:hypothetical protein